MSDRTTGAFDFSNMSNRKINQIENQLNNIYKQSDMNQIGESRHKMKTEIMNSPDYQKGGSHEINSKIGITSYSSEDKRKNQWENFAKFCFSECGCHQVKQIKSDMIRDFAGQLVERQYSYNTAKQYLSSIEKLGNMLQNTCGDACGGYKDWHNVIDDCRAIVKADCPVKDINTRAYDRPEAIVDLVSERVELPVSLMLSSGLRISDACNIQHVSPDGVLTVTHSKGGQSISVQMSDRQLYLYNKYKDGNGCVITSKNSVDYQVEKACDLSGQLFQGCHGLRHNFAQDNMARAVNSGVPYNQALYNVSEKMGHHRVEITLTYLR